MKDFVFLDSFYWLIMNRDFLIMSTSVFTFIALLITVLLLLRKWGDSY